MWGRPCDAADFEHFSALVAEVTEVYGPVEVLVNVAGTFKMSDFADSKPPDWSEMLSANLITALVACRAVLPGMLEARSGAIVNFASTAGEYGSIRPAAVYAAAKAGVIGFTKSLAREVSPMGVRVNAISPGPVDTPALKAVTDAERAVAASRTLVGRLGNREILPTESYTWPATSRRSSRARSCRSTVVRSFNPAPAKLVPAGSGPAPAAAGYVLALPHLSLSWRSTSP